VVHDLMLRDFLVHRTILLSQRAADLPSRFAAYRRILYCLSEAGIAQLYQELAHHVGEILAPTMPAVAYPTGHGADDG
jgi:hypothetical protein